MSAKFSQVLSWEQKKKQNIIRYADNSGIIKTYTSGYRWLMIKTVYINHAQMTVIYWMRFILSVILLNYT